MSEQNIGEAAVPASSQDTLPSLVELEAGISGRVELGLLGTQLSIGMINNDFLLIIP